MRTFFALLFIAISVSAGAQDFHVPALTGPVVDQAGIIDGQVARVLENGLRNLHDAGGTQITVLTVESLGGLTIEQASIQVVDQWKLGGAKTHNGVLLMVAPNERKVRIEVGRELEASLTDAYSNRIIRDVILPHFKDGDYSEGVLQGVAAIIGYTDPNIDISSLFGQVRSRPAHRGFSWAPLLFFLFILFFIGRGGGGRRGRVSPWTAGALGYALGRGSSGWGGGGGWSGGGGGGGWSGGGGGFNGGGASGGW